MNVEKQENSLPFDIEDDVGKIREIQEEGAGVYFVFTYPEDGWMVGNEMYIVEAKSPYISNLAKKYGSPLPHHPQLLQYSTDSTPGTHRIIEFELARYRLKNGLPLESGETIHSLSMLGMEECPCYFGNYPAPVISPYGKTIRYKTLSNGVYWIETDQFETILALCNAYEDEISEGARKLALTLPPRPDAPEPVVSYMFFLLQASCIPIYELLPIHSHWLTRGLIRKDALMNAIWRWNPEYAISHNLFESSGLNNGMGLLLDSLGVQPPFRASPENMISLSQSAETNFCTLFE